MNRSIGLMGTSQCGGINLQWREPVMRRAWTHIQDISDSIEGFLGLDRQVPLLGRILTQQTVGVLTGAALPGTM